MSATIALNRRARHKFFIEKTLEAGLHLEGWEVKSLRAHHVQLNDGSYVTIKNHEAWLMGCHISPLSTASTHIHPDTTRTRKLLLTARELKQLSLAVQQQGYTIVPLKLYWQRKFAKLSIGVARGKKLYDKRAALKAKDWERDKQRLSRLLI
jgi:SsrA-binding protein